MYGSDKQYLPEVVPNAMKECVTRKQGNNSPAESSEVTGSNMDVFHDVGMIPDDETLFTFPQSRSL